MIGEVLPGEGRSPLCSAASSGSRNPSIHRFLASIGLAVYSLRPEPSPGLHRAKIGLPPATCGSSNLISSNARMGRVSARSASTVLISRLAISGISSVESSNTTVADRGPSTGHSEARSSGGGRSAVV
jgi:hypothetical protein